jgi:hypothetical protein
MKKFLVVLSGIAFVTLLTLSVQAQDPQKKATETKAKTEKCDPVKSKACPKSCDKKAEATKCDDKKEEKKERKEVILFVVIRLINQELAF